MSTSPYFMKRITELNDRALIKMLLQEEDYQPDFLEAVKDELDDRNLTTLEIEAIEFELLTQPDQIERQAAVYEGVIGWIKRRLGMR